jgi:post-segregation antitoxin (ccd killing protein)
MTDPRHRSRFSYDPSAPRQTVSITLNSELYAQARALDINASRVAEEALAYRVKEKRAEQIRREIEQDVAALGALVEAHREEFDDMDREFERLRTEYGERDTDA